RAPIVVSDTAQLFVTCRRSGNPPYPFLSQSKHMAFFWASCSESYSALTAASAGSLAAPAATDRRTISGAEPPRTAVVTAAARCRNSRRSGPALCLMVSSRSLRPPFSSRQQVGEAHPSKRDRSTLRSGSRRVLVQHYLQPLPLGREEQRD